MSGPPNGKAPGRQSEGELSETSNDNGQHAQNAGKATLAKWWQCESCRGLTARTLIDLDDPRCASCGHRAAPVDLAAEIADRRKARAGES